MEQNKALYPGEIRLFCQFGIAFQGKDFSDLVKPFLGDVAVGFMWRLHEGER